MTHSKAKNINMTSGPILPEMLRFALPLIATYMLDLAFTAADKLVAGRCAGSGALAAVSACGPVINLMVGFFNGLAIGGTVVVARHIGAKNLCSAEKVVHTAACMGGIISIIVILLATVICKPMLILLHTPQDILANSVLYFRIRIVGIGLDIIYKFCSGTLRASGETKKPLIFSTVAGILNVGLNYLLVAGFSMGVAGLAIATDVSGLACVVGVLIFQFHTDSLCRLELKKLRIDWKSVKEIFRIGIPSSIQTSCFNISNAAIQGAINSLGTASVAGGSAAVSYISIGSNVVQAADHATTTWTSQNFGAKQLDRVWKTVRSALTIAAIFLLPLAAAYILFGPSLLAVFVPSDDPNFRQIITYGMVRLHFMGCFQLLHAAMNIGGGALRGLQKPWMPMLAAITGSVILRMLWIHFVFPLHPVSEMIYICYPITWLLTAGFDFFALSAVLTQYKKKPLLPTT